MYFPYLHYILDIFSLDRGKSSSSLLKKALDSILPVLLHLLTFVWACFQFKNFQESIIKILSKFPSQVFLKSLNISVYISHSIDSITVTWVSLERSFLLQNLRNVHRHWRLWLEDMNFILVLKTMMFYSLAVLVVKYCFYHPKIKLISLSNPIIFPDTLYRLVKSCLLPYPTPHLSGICSYSVHFTCKTLQEGETTSSIFLCEAETVLMQCSDCMTIHH